MTGSRDSRAIADSTMDPGNSIARVKLYRSTKPSE